jgi:hypothetical protein
LSLLKLSGTVSVTPDSVRRIFNKIPIPKCNIWEGKLWVIGPLSPEFFPHFISFLGAVWSVYIENVQQLPITSWYNNHNRTARDPFILADIFGVHIFFVEYKSYSSC